MSSMGGKLPPVQDRRTAKAEDAPAPFSLRLTFEERASLEQAAGDIGLFMTHARQNVGQSGGWQVQGHVVMSSKLHR
jgi:hypothetical protein